MSENTEEKKIEIVFKVEGETITSSSTMNKDLSVYSIVTAMESLIGGLKYKLTEYLHSNRIMPEDEDFHSVIQNITVKDLQE